MYNILVTCGRGFEKHVVKEIEDIVLNASSITVINEGKVSFKLDNGSSMDFGRDLEKQENELFTLPDVEVLKKLYKLKLVERLMLLLFHQDFDDPTAQCEIKQGASAVTRVCNSIDWAMVNQQVKALLDANVPSPNVMCSCALEQSNNITVCKDKTDMMSSNAKEIKQTSNKGYISMVDVSPLAVEEMSTNAKETTQTLNKDYISMVDVSPLSVEEMSNKIKYHSWKKLHCQNRKQMRHNSDIDDSVIPGKSLSLPLNSTNSEDDNQTCDADGKTCCNAHVSFGLKPNDKKRMKMDIISCSQFVPSENSKSQVLGDVIKTTSEQEMPIVENVVRFRASCRVTGSWKTALRAKRRKPKVESSPGSCLNCKNSDTCANRVSVGHKRSIDSTEDSCSNVRSATELNKINIGSSCSTFGDDQTNMLSARNSCLVTTNGTNALQSNSSLLLIEPSNLDIDCKLDQESSSRPASDSSLNPDNNALRNECPNSSVKQTSDSLEDVFIETKCLSRSLTNTSNTDPYVSSNPILAPLVENVLQRTNWQLDWLHPQVDVYFNLTNLHALLGVSVTRTPLSLRPYIPHISLRSSVCCLMLQAALPRGSNSALPTRPADTNKSPVKRLHTHHSPTSAASSTSHGMIDDVSPDVISENMLPQFDNSCITVLDPMCGAGTILAEATYSFKVGRVIGCDVSWDQLCLARCNLRSLPAGCTASLLRSDAACLPLKSSSVDAVVCDFPFGQKHHEYLANRGMSSGNCNSNGSGGHNPKNLVAPQEGTRVPNDADSSCLLHRVLDESARVVVPGGRVVLLVAASMEPLLLRYTGNKDSHTTVGSLSLVSQERLSLGTTPGLVCVLQRQIGDRPFK